MRKPITTKTHGVLDYLTIGSFLFLPRLLGFSKATATGMTAVGLTKLGYTLFTNHELGLVKALPMKAHLAMDVAGGAMLCALPFMAGHDVDDLETAVCTGLGAFDIAAAPLTETEADRRVRLAARDPGPSRSLPAWSPSVGPSPVEEENAVEGSTASRD
jgi:hypothetical protein